jgi:predicted lipid-binding transport protein (Tim44 family)
MVGVLMLGLLFWAKDADARLKSEWRFGGTALSSFIASSVNWAFFDNAENDDSVSSNALPQAATQPSPGGTLIGLFSRPGMVGGFAAGFLGAGALGLVFGQGVAGGLNGTASMLGLMFQIVLVVMLARLIWTWWRADKAGVPRFSPRQLADAYGSSRNEKLPEIDSATGDGSFGETTGGTGKTRR